MAISIKSAKGLENIPLAKIVRLDVFVKEQGFHNEFDEIDQIAHHIVLFDGEKPIGTGRCFPDSENPKRYHIGRVSILKDYRKRNLGDTIMSTLEEKIKESGGDSVELSAQVRAKKFYSRLGYKEEGEEYLDEFCPHIKMVKKIE